MDGAPERFGLVRSKKHNNGRATVTGAGPWLEEVYVVVGWAGGGFVEFEV